MIIRSRTAACTSYFDPGHRLANLLCPAYIRKCVDFQLSCQRFGDSATIIAGLRPNQRQKRVPGFRVATTAIICCWSFSDIEYSSCCTSTTATRCALGREDLVGNPQGKSGAGGMLWQGRYNTVHQDRHPRGICFIHNSAATVRQRQHHLTVNVHLTALLSVTSYHDQHRLSSVIVNKTRQCHCQLDSGVISHHDQRWLDSTITSKSWQCHHQLASTATSRHGQCRLSSIITSKTRQHHRQLDSTVTLHSQHRLGSAIAGKIRQRHHVTANVDSVAPWPTLTWHYHL
jgi:hypothetical protein